MTANTSPAKSTSSNEDVANKPKRPATRLVRIGDSNARSFTVSNVICEGVETDECCLKGRFIGKDPASAARKASSKIFKKLFGENESKPFVIHIRETTKKSKNGEYRYSATRALIDHRNVAFKTKDGDTTPRIPFKYQVNVRSLAERKKMGGAAV